MKVIEQGDRRFRNLSLDRIKGEYSDVDDTNYFFARISKIIEAGYSQKGFLIGSTLDDFGDHSGDDYRYIQKIYESDRRSLRGRLQ